MRITSCGLVLLVALVGCGDDGGAGSDAGGNSDALADGPPVDVNETLLPLLGSWTRAPEADPSFGFDDITFRADGTTTSEGEAGTFSVSSPGRIVLGNTTNTETTESNYVVTANRLLLSAFLPLGTVTGFVGLWSVNAISNGASSTTTIQVRADNTAKLRIVGPTGTFESEGTWVAASTGFDFTTTTAPIVTYPFRPLGAEAIGYLLFAK